jgi:indolepyruvate ferredoxin oxidoreductase, alpha subunit
VVLVAARAERGAEQVLLGDEAVALAMVHAGGSAAYAYPGTPSTEIVEYLIRYAESHPEFKAFWSVNEKAAYEEALGVSMMGRRTLVAMKHVGLNVAADPFMNSTVVSIHGGLVVAVADDPGMHSSQNEQDSRYFADFARAICLEPANQQEAYEMTREAYEVSERFHLPVMIRLVTRLAHSRAVVRPSPAISQRVIAKPPDPTGWILLPSNARRQWKKVIESQQEVDAWSNNSGYNTLATSTNDRGLGVITTGIARNYYLESLPDLGYTPSHLHVGAYPMPFEKIRELAARVKQVLVIEEGYPFVERYLRGILATPLPIHGKLDGRLPPDGELTPDIIRTALELEPKKGLPVLDLKLPSRPPQLCPGCPHADTYTALRRALADFDRSVVTSDIGCYTLGALPPYEAIESCVCMGASVSMAKGAADAGLYPSVGVIGDGTFYHSGVTPLIDAIAHNTDMTLIILDNATTAMTGTQPTILPSEKLESFLLGLGVAPEHLKVFEVHPKKVAELQKVIKQELDHHGLSVIVAYRECLEIAKHSK